MARIIWKEQYNTGIEIIDIQHKKIATLFNDLSQAMEMGNSELIIKNIISSVIQYADYHFKTEEGLMTKAAYKDLKAHKKDILNLDKE